jgi:hypothetical protein
MPVGKQQFLGEMGGTVLPYIGDWEFKELLRCYGRTVTLMQLQETEVCSCFDGNWNSFDSNCEICAGNGSAQGYLSKVIKCVVIPKSERGQGYHQKLHSKAGDITTFDAYGFIQGRHWDNTVSPASNEGIKAGRDYLIVDGIEMRIIGIIPRWGSIPHRPVFILLELERITHQVVSGVDRTGRL